MKETTRRLWDEQNRHPNDRLRLFTAVTSAFDIDTALYPGSFVDIAASFVIDSVTYVDSDRRAAKFFGDVAGVEAIVATHRTDDRAAFAFIHADYNDDLGLDDGSYDLLISLYAGFVSAACTRYLRPGGWLLVNPSHGDAAMASIDPRYELVAVVTSQSGTYRVDDRDLDGYLIPKRSLEVTADLLRSTGRGVAYTKSPFAYVFRRVGEQ
jgi:hypothetical protein